MRKQKPFARPRMLKSASTNNNNNSSTVMNNNTINLATSAVHNMATTAVALSNDYLGAEGITKISSGPAIYSASGNRDRLTEGLNNISKSILQQRGGMMGNQIEQHDDIPLRPLLLNGQSQTLSPGAQSQNKMNE